MITFSVNPYCKVKDVAQAISYNHVAHTNDLINKVQWSLKYSN